MNDEKSYECAVCFFRGNMARFAPITVSADFSALECPKCLNNDRDSFQEVEAENGAVPHAA